MNECVVRMEMPNGCHDCKLRNMIGNCPIPVFDSQDEEKIWTLAECFQRPPWCPIICQLPDGHGRLVDADAFEKDVSDALVYGLKEIPSEEGKQIFHVLMQEVLDNVKKRKTIVPAERKET